MNGDNNTRFFHIEAKIRRQRDYVGSIKTESGQTINDPKLIIKEGIFFFQKLWNSEISFSSNDYLSIQPCISDHDNSCLISIPSKEEIKRVVWAMPNCKSPGPDGFGPSFYKSSWDIIKEDLIANVQNFFRRGKLPTNWNQTKKATPKSFSKYRPISICNFNYKII